MMKDIQTLDTYFSELAQQDKYSGVVLVTQGKFATDPAKAGSAETSCYLF